MKDLSASDIEGVMCPPRYLAERWCGMREESEPMKIGIALHDVAKTVLRGQQKGIDMGRDEVRQLLRASRIPAHYLAMDGGGEDAMLWWMERIHGTLPLDVERPRRVKLCGRWFVFKPDCARRDDSGKLHIDDWKSGYIPDREACRRNPRFMLYGLAGARFYQVKEVQSDIWNLSSHFTVSIPWSTDELDKYEYYLEPEIKEIDGLLAIIGRTKKKADRLKLIFQEPFTPCLNTFCDSCPLRSRCKPYKRLMLEGMWEPGSTDTERVQRAEVAARVSDKARETLRNALIARVLRDGKRVMIRDNKGNPKPVTVLRDGNLEAVLRVDEYPVMPFTQKEELLKSVLMKGTVENQVSGGKSWSLHIGKGLHAMFECPANDEPIVIAAADKRITKKLVIRYSGSKETGDE